MGIEPATCGLQNRCSAVELRQQTLNTVLVTKRIIQQAFCYVNAFNARKNSNRKIPPRQIDNMQKTPMSIYLGSAKTR